MVPAGGPNVRLPVAPKKPTTYASATVVVSDGAVTVDLSVLTTPLERSTGRSVSASLKASTPPDAAADRENRHAYVVGSADVATFE